MSYIGRGIDQIDNISTLDNLSFNGSDATFNLTQNSVAFVPVSADALQIQIDGVIQSGNYTVSGSTVTFDFTPSGSSVCNGIRHYGVGLLTTVSDSSITTAKLGADSVNGSKIADDSISDEHLDITAITGQTAITSLADTDKFLVSDASDSGNLKYVEKQYLPSGTHVKITGVDIESGTGVDAINVTNCFSTTYDYYKVVIRRLLPEDDAGVKFQLLYNTSDLFDSNEYRQNNTYFDDANRHLQNTGSSDNNFTIANDGISQANGEQWGGHSYVMYCILDRTDGSGNAFKYHGTGSWTDSSNRQVTTIMGGFITKTSTQLPVTGLTFKGSGGQLRKGNITVYGIVQ